MEKIEFFGGMGIFVGYIVFGEDVGVLGDGGVFGFYRS